MNILTDDEINESYRVCEHWTDFARAIEAAIMERFEVAGFVVETEHQDGSTTGPYVILTDRRSYAVSHCDFGDPVPLYALKEKK